MSDGLPIDGQMIDCEKSILSEQAALRLGPAWDGGAPPLASAPHFLKDAEKVRQRRSRIAQRLNVPKRTSRLFARCGLAGRAFLSILCDALVLSCTSISVAGLEGHTT